MQFPTLNNIGLMLSADCKNYFGEESSQVYIMYIGVYDVFVYDHMEIGTISTPPFYKNTIHYETDDI